MNLIPIKVECHSGYKADEYPNFIPGYVCHITHRCHKKEFLMEKLGIKAKGREVVKVNGKYNLKEPVIYYKPIFTPENGDLRLKNTYF